VGEQFDFSEQHEGPWRSLRAFFDKAENLATYGLKWFRICVQVPENALSFRFVAE
jgi:hypothetical protein